MNPAERAAYLNRIADLWEARKEPLADTWLAASGVLRAFSTHAAVGFASVFRFYAGMGDTFVWTEKHTTPAGSPSLVVRDLGVAKVSFTDPYHETKTMIFETAPAAML